MRRRLAASWRWLSRGLAALGVLLALAFVALDVRSRRLVDDFVCARTFAVAGGPAACRSHAVGAVTLRGDVGFWWEATDAGAALASFGMLDDGGRPHRPFEASWKTSRLDAFWSTPKATWTMPALGVSVDTGTYPWDGQLASRHARVALPLWMLAVLSALPAAVLLIDRWRRRRLGTRGFSVVTAGDELGAALEPGGRK